MQLDKQVVIVTGAGRGIGRAIAERCVEEGAKVALVSRTGSQLEETAAGIRQARGIALPVPTDVTNLTEVVSMVDKVEGELGPVDAIINNAGSCFGVGPAWEVDPETWWQDVRVNVLGVHLCCRAVIPGMIERGKGRLINMIGGGTAGPITHIAGYGTSKAAVMRYTECLAAELKDYGIPVFAMGPGLVRTSMTEHQLESEAGKKWMPRIKEMFEQGRNVPPTLAANLAVELASGRFDALSGRAFNAGEDLDRTEERIEEILEKDLKTLRMRSG